MWKLKQVTTPLRLFPPSKNAGNNKTSSGSCKNVWDKIFSERSPREVCPNHARPASLYTEPFIRASPLFRMNRYHNICFQISIVSQLEDRKLKENNRLKNKHIHTIVNEWAWVYQKIHQCCQVGRPFLPTIKIFGWKKRGRVNCLSLCIWCSETRWNKHCTFVKIANLPLVCGHGGIEVCCLGNSKTVNILPLVVLFSEVVNNPW